MGMPSFVVVPQWQGSPSSRAMRLAEGAAALRGDLPAQGTREVPVPLESGDAQGTGIARFSSLQLVRERLTDVLGEVAAPAIVVGGDCSVSDAAVRFAAERHPELAVVWFDAHPDLNTPTTSPSGAYAGMVLRSLISDGPLSAPRVVLAGARSWDAEEERFAETERLVSLAADAVDADALVAAVSSTGAESVYIHVDLDVLDPAELRGLLDPEPFGVPTGALTSAIRALLERFPLAGATIASYAPTGDEDLAEDGPTILRIIGALSPRPAR
jgi:arginase